MSRPFFRSLILLVVLNLLIKPVWIFAIDRQVQNITGFSAYGEYFALLNLCIILNFLLDLGISSYFNRRTAARPQEGLVLFSVGLRGKLILSFFYSIAVFFAAFVSGVREFGLLSLLILLQIGSSFLLFLRAYLTAAQQYTYDSIISVTDKAIVILAAGSLLIVPEIFGGMTIMRFTFIQIGALFFTLMLCVFFLIRSVPEFKIRPEAGFRKDLIAFTLPFAINIFLMSLMARADGFLLERIHPQGSAEAGIYAAGYRLLDAFNMVGYLMAGFLLPFIARHWPNLNSFSPVVLACRHLLVLGSMLVACIVLASPTSITQLLYNTTDPYTVRVVGLILLALPALSMTHIYGTVLTATGHIRSFLRITIIYAIINLVCNLVFIPAYGALACACIAVITQVAYSIHVIYRARRASGIGLWLSSLPVYAAAGTVCFVIIKLAVRLQMNLLWSAAIAATVVTLIFLYYSRLSLGQIRRLLTEK